MAKIFYLLLVAFMFIGYGQSTAKKRIFILHSYSQEYGWTKLQHESFVKNLQNSLHSPMDFSVEYLDTKRTSFTAKYQQFFLSYLQKKFDGYRPDAIYVTDDNALEFFIEHRSELFSGIPVFFSGVNNLSLAETLKKGSYTGVYESKEVVPNIELIRQFSPQTRDIWFVGDDSSTYKSIERDIRNQIDQYPNYTFHFIASPNIDEIIAKLPTSPKSFILLTTIGGLSDSSGRNLTLQESIERLKQNKHLVLCSMEDAYVLGGVIGGYVTSGTLQGEHASQLTTRYLQGTPVEKIESVTKSPNTYMFDRRSLVDSRLVLSEYTARNAIIIHEEKTFFEQHQEMILNGMFIALTLFFIFLIIVYFVIGQKRMEIKALTEQLVELSHLKSKKV